jgi:hypothetical protein
LYVRARPFSGTDLNHLITHAQAHNLENPHKGTIVNEVRGQQADMQRKSCV